MVTWRVLTESVRGASHHRNGLPNQDAVAFAQNPLVVAVADGHGSTRCTRSHLGAKFAVEAAIEMVQQVFNAPNLSLPQLRTLSEGIPKAIHRCWQSKVDAYINDYLKIEDCLRIEASIENRYLLFGTTLLVACVLENCVLYWQIGDGDIVVIQADGTPATPIPHDERLLGNDTTSLCGKNPSQDFRVAFLPIIAPPKAIFLVSDGYKNSFKEAEGFTKALIDIHGFIETEGANFVGTELAGWLNEASQSGSGDDISLAVIYAAG
jgi:serine/threonine protein phosphatase PrpC